MKKQLLIIFAVFIFALFAFNIYGQNFTVGLVSNGPLKANSDAAYSWAQKNFKAQVIPIPKTKNDLMKFGVVWWDESNSAQIPDDFKDKAVIDAFLGYLKDGGGLLLSNLAFHYVYEMGIEPENLRYYAGNANSPLDWTDFQIPAGQEKHPIFKGLKIEGNLIQYDIQGWTEGSDFYAAAGPLGPKDKNATILAQTVDGHPQCNGLVEYKVGNGAMIIIGWVWSSWVVNKKLENVHG
ncbi:MAG: DUF4960 domain-containing protein [Candidatus Poribacteria bacterium]